MRPRDLLPAVLLAGTLTLAIHTEAASDVSPKDHACKEPSARILILGSYHMDNPGLDEFNVEADDVLSPRRQKELEEVVEKLARYRPTKIALEVPHNSSVWPDRYKKYLAGEYVLGPSEKEQIGFRLAKRLGHKAIFPVDYPMWMSGWTPAELDFTQRETKQLPSASQDKESTPPPPSEEDLRLRRSTIREYLLYLNDEDFLRNDHEQYMGNLWPGEGVYIYQRTDSLTNWYKRNFRIFTNLVRITEFGQDRILLVIGSGHQKILRDLAIDATPYCLVETETYLK